MTFPEEVLEDEVEGFFTTFPELEVVVVVTLLELEDVVVLLDELVPFGLALLVDPPNGFVEVEDPVEGLLVVVEDELVDPPNGLLELLDVDELVLLELEVALDVGFLVVDLNNLLREEKLIFASACFAGVVPIATPVIVAIVVATPMDFNIFSLDFFPESLFPVSLPMYFPP